MELIPIKKVLTNHEEMVYRLCEEGVVTRETIALQMEVSVTRVGQIYNSAKIKVQDVAQNGGDALSLLPSRARRVVVNCGIPTRAKVCLAIQSGRMEWLPGCGGILWDGCMIRNVSHKTWAAIHAWAGHPPLAMNSMKIIPVVSGDCLLVMATGCQKPQAGGAFAAAADATEQAALKQVLLKYPDLHPADLKFDGLRVEVHPDGGKSLAVNYALPASAKSTTQAGEVRTITKVIIVEMTLAGEVTGVNEIEQTRTELVNAP